MNHSGRLKWLVPPAAIGIAICFWVRHLPARDHDSRFVGTWWHLNPPWNPEEPSGAMSIIEVDGIVLSRNAFDPSWRGAPKDWWIENGRLVIRKRPDSVLDRAFNELHLAIASALNRPLPRGTSFAEIVMVQDDRIRLKWNGKTIQDLVRSETGP
jgi:hypothetical protein